MIYTGCYKNCNGINTISVSGDRGKGVNYNGLCYPKLSPKLSFWKVWHDNIGKISEQENNDFYIIEYYLQVLRGLNAEKVMKELDGKILLCYEDSLEFCHRHIVSSWLETELGIVVKEVKIVNGNIVEIEKNSNIKEDYKRLILRK